MFVTGGASGIGADIVRAFAAQRRQGRLRRHPGRRPAARSPRETRRRDPVPRAATSPTSPALQAAIDEVARSGSARSACWSTTPPMTTATPIDEVTAEYWDRCAGRQPAARSSSPRRRCSAQMRELGGGSIINFSSIAWRFGADEMAAYATAKAGVIGLTRALARALRPRQHPRQRHRAGRRDHRAAAPAVVSRRRNRSRRWSQRQSHPAGAARRGDRPHRAVPRRRRQPDDHQAVDHRRRAASSSTQRNAAELRVGLNPYGLTYISACRAAARRAPTRTARGSRASSPSPRNSARRALEICDPGSRRCPTPSSPPCGAALDGRSA